MFIFKIILFIETALIKGNSKQMKHLTLSITLLETFPCLFIFHLFMFVLFNFISLFPGCSMTMGTLMIDTAKLKIRMSKITY